MGYADEKHIQIKAENLKSQLLTSAWHQGHVHCQACQPLHCGQPLAWACNWIKPSPLLAPQLTGREHRGAALSAGKDLGLSLLLLQHHWSEIRQELSAAGWSLNVTAWGPPYGSRWNLLPSCGHPGSALTGGKLRANGPLRGREKTDELSHQVRVADLGGGKGGTVVLQLFGPRSLYTHKNYWRPQRSFIWIDSLLFRNYNWETFKNIDIAIL